MIKLSPSGLPQAAQVGGDRVQLTPTWLRLGFAKPAWCPLCGQALGRGPLIRGLCRPIAEGIQGPGARRPTYVPWGASANREACGALSPGVREEGGVAGGPGGRGDSEKLPGSLK